MKRIFLVLICTLLVGTTVHAQNSADASVQVECTGQPDAQVAIRWGHPNYNLDQYMPLFTTPCGVGIRETKLRILNPNSELEVQTEGGIETSYVIKVAISGSKGTRSIELSHAGSPDVITRGNGFTLSRSSGPNSYGEQNFRVQLQSGMAATARIVAQSTGNKADAQMALRWGHSDYDEHEYFPTWAVKAGASQEKIFRLTDPKSEFEIQTEGGEGTGYHLSIWLDAGQGSGMQPSIEITHKLYGTQVTTSTMGVKFEPTKGNAYGEMNVRVTVPGIVESPPTNWTTLTFGKQTGPGGGGPIPYAAQLGLGSGPAGHFTKIRSAEQFDVELVGVGDGATTDDCGKANGRTRILRARQELPASDFQALYGVNPTYPKAFVACSYRDVSAFSIQVYTVPN